MQRAVEKHVPINPLSKHKIILSPGTRALQKHAKKISKKLHRGGLPVSTHGELRRDLALDKKMIRDHVESDSAKFFTGQWNKVSTQNEAFATIKRFSGHKARPRFAGSLFTDNTKSNVVAGIEVNVEAFADLFEINHQLTHDWASVDDGTADATAGILAKSHQRIHFGDRIPANIPDNDTLDTINDRLPARQRGLLTSTSEIAEIICQRPNKKSSGDDEMPYFILKKLDAGIIEFIATFFNHLIANAYFPMKWRFAKVTPIPKPNRDNSIIGNWRPISQLPCISKVFERTIANRLLANTDNNQFFPDQFGFLTRHSAEHALARLQANITNGLNAGKVTSIVALDLRAAFDTIWHNGLIHRMACLELNEFLIRIVQSMLTDRTFAVCLEGHTSSVRRMVAGVPQGSVLSPICFNYFMVTMPSHPRCGKIQFADDTTIFRVHRNAGRARADLNGYLVALGRFFLDSKLLLNGTKSELQHVLGLARETNNKSLRRATQGMAVSIHGHRLLPNKNTRILGLQFQTNGRHIRHIDLRLQKLRRAKFMLKGIIRNGKIGPRIKTNIYKLYLRPIMTFASPVWCLPPRVSSHQMERLRTFERSVLRSTTNTRRARNSYRHINASNIYRDANCPRIDGHIIQRHRRFYETLRDSNVTKLTDITAHSVVGIHPPINQILDLDSGGQLHDGDGKVMLFHHRYDGQPGTVYCSNQ